VGTSAREGVEAVVEARGHNLPVYAETLHHYASLMPRTTRSREASLWRLDLDHLGAHIGEHFPALRALLITKIEHPKSLEQSERINVAP
jgi:hypothetical protein